MASTSPKHPRRSLWRTTTGPVVLALTVALVLAATTPATAKRDDPPPPAQVTFSFVHDEPGLANCYSWPLEMVKESWRGDGTSLLAFAYAGYGDPADLDLYARFEEPPPPLTFEMGECDYGTRQDSPVPDSGIGTLLWMAFDRTGDLAEFVWHFNACVDDEPRTHGKKSKEGSPRVRDRYTLALVELESQEKVQDEVKVTGSFKLSRYTNYEPGAGCFGNAPPEDLGPTWTEIGSQELKFKFRITD